MKENKNAWLAFWCVAFFWGTTYLAIRIGVKSFPPLLFAGLRHLFAGILILTYFTIKKFPLPPRNQLKHIVVMSLLMLGVGNGLLVCAQQHIDSGLAAIISSTFPFAVFFFSWLLGQERLNGWVLAGIGLGFTGQLFIFYDKLEKLSNPEYLGSIVALFVAVICWGYGAVYRKKAKITMHSLHFSGWQMVLAGVCFLPLALLQGEHHKVGAITSQSVWAFLYLVLFGSILAYGCFMYVLNKLPATVVSMYSHINTIVAVFLGWIVLYEPLNLNIGFSTVLTLTGVYLVNKGMNQQKSRL